MGEAAAAAIFAVLKWVAVVVSVASTAYSIIKGQDSPEPMDPMEEPGVKFNTRSTQEAERIVYGLQQVGGNDVFIETSGSDGDNQYLWIVQTLSAGPCEAINTDGGLDQIWLGDLLESKFGAMAVYWFHDGSYGQAVDAALNNRIPAWTDTLSGTCYIVFRLDFDRDYFQNMPKRLIELKGRKLYDFRDGTTAWSQNGVLALYDYMTSQRYGMGISPLRIDLTSWTSAANYFDTKGWTFNMTVYKNGAAMDTINAMLAHFRGTLVWFDGKFYLRYADLNEESSCMTLNDEHIVQDTQGRAAVSVSQPSKFKRPDALRVKFIDPDKYYVVDDIMLGDDSGVVNQLDLLGCTDRDMAANLGVYNLERMQLDRIITGRFRDDAVKLDPHDLVTFNCSGLSISDQLMRVQDANILPGGQIELTLAYEDFDLYDDDYNLSADSIYTCSLTDPRDEPPSVENASMTEETYDYRDRTFTRLNIDFDTPSEYAWFDHVEVYLSDDNSTWKYLYNVNTDFSIDNVEEGLDYYVRLKVVTIWGTKQSDTNDTKLHKSVVGYVDAPESLGSLEAIVNKNSVNLYSNKVSDTDIELYEFRLGSSWGNAIFLAALRAPNLSLTGVKPGSHTFIANTLSNNGEYGATPRTKSVTLIDPPDDWAVQDTDTIENLIANGDMEADANWADFGVPTTNEQSDTQKHDGSYSRKFIADNVLGLEGIKSDTFTTVNSADYGGSVWVYPDSSTVVRLKVRTGDDSGYSYEETFSGLTQDAWNELSFTFSEGAGTGGAGAYLVICTTSEAAWTYYVDDACILRGDFSDNMTPVLYSGDPYIKCAHDSNVLDGVYVSEVFDVGSSDRYLVYVLADVLVTGTGTTWDDKFPSPTTWDQGGASTKTWNEIFQLSAGPAVRISLNYGAASVAEHTVERMEILSAIVTGRYFQVEIEVIDPNVNVNALIEAFTIKYCQ